MTDVSDWSAGTFEGTIHWQRQAVATSSPDRRLRWLEEVLRMAEASGALDRTRAERQRRCEADWFAGQG